MDVSQVLLWIHCSEGDTLPATLGHVAWQESQAVLVPEG